MKIRNPYLDIIKGICILFVIVTHFSWTEEERIRLLFPFWIDMAVLIFMIVSGYVYTKSFGNNKYYWELYKAKYVLAKFIRFTIPYGMVFVVEFIIEYFVYENNIAEWESLFLQGGLGPGSYYYPVMIQFIFWFPIIYMI